MQEVEIRFFEYESEEYFTSLYLRNEILRKPIGIDILNDELLRDKNCLHVGAFCKGSLVGVVIIVPECEKTYKLKQFAVLENFQKRGIGRTMLAFCEKYAKEQGAEKLYLHARVCSLDFYVKCGFSLLEDEFTEVGIPHHKAEKRL